MDIIAAIWIIAAVLAVGSWLIFMVPIPAIITLVTMTTILISYKLEQRKKEKNE